MALSNSDIVDLITVRRDLHRHPEVSGDEIQTARTIASALTAWSPTTVLTGLGGHGVAAVFDSGNPGPTVMVRSELDALPIVELGDIPHASEIPGKGHLCGHDGHSTILLGVARLLSRRRPDTGRVVLMFQPAEEDGSGAAAVIADPQFTGDSTGTDTLSDIENLAAVVTDKALTQAGLPAQRNHLPSHRLAGHGNHLYRQRESTQILNTLGLIGNTYKLIGNRGNDFFTG